MQESVTIALTAGTAGIAAAVRPGAVLPVEAMMLGRPAIEVAEALPRLFSLCRAAQGAAARLALGLPTAARAQDLRAEVLRDHLLKLLLTWPRLLGLPPGPMPRPDDRALALFGPGGTMPATPATFHHWMRAGQGMAPLMARLSETFAPGEAIAELPLVTPDTAMSGAALENSPAARHADHPVLRMIAASHGPGPLWRAAARLADAQACLDGTLPLPARLPGGIATSPAARGLYALQAAVADGRVTALARRTPTDHMLAPGGMLERSFASLPTAKRALAPLVLDILDPCVPCELQEVDHA